MRFESGDILYWLWAMPLLVLLLIWLQYRKNLFMTRFAQKGLLDEIGANVAGRKNRYKQILFVCVFVFSILALARPQWGFQWQEIKREGLDILLVIDTSKSMLTQDVKPNRLERTKLAVRDMLNKLHGDRIGLLAFAGKAFLVCPLTVDYSGFLLSLEDLDTSTIPRGGTNIAAAIDEATKEYDTTPSKYKAVIILTDGENWEGDPLAAAAKAEQKGIKIYCVGIGTPEGELIRVPNSSGQYDFLKDESGNFVKSRLNEKLLQQIALTTGGIYVRASGAQFGLDLIYDQELSRIEKREIQEKMEKKYFERFQWPLSIALFLLLLETILINRRETRMT